MTYACAQCGGPVTAADNVNGGLIAINVDGHAKPAHRACPTPTDPNPARDHGGEVMSGYTGFIQPIVVRRSGTHEEMVEAAARASVGAWIADPHNPAWKPWLAASFGKTVRRARPVEVEKCREFFVASAAVGKAEAFACLPVATDQMPGEIRKLQVSGTDRERDHWTPEPGTGPRVRVNLEAGMSTGKTCAQVAHGVFAWALAQSPDRLVEWQEAGLPFEVRDAPAEEFEALRARAPFVIEDAGHTEVEPGTATVVVLN